MSAYKVTLNRRGTNHVIVINASDDIDACWQAYNTAKVRNMTLVNVESTPSFCQYWQDNADL